MTNKKGGLKRGLDVFIKDKDNLEDLIKPQKKDQVIDLDIKDITANEDQARKSFDPDRLKDLAKSIESYGVIQPIIVRKLDDKYEIIAGERRYRASKLAGKNTIPAIIKDLDDFQREKISLIENVQREDLNPYEEALAYKSIIEKYELTQEDLAKGLGKSRPYISNTIRLLRLDDRVLELLKDGKISYSIARELLSIQDKDAQYEKALEIVKNSLTVKDLTQKKKKKTKVKKTNIFLEEIEERFINSLGTKVKIDDDRKVISINYYDNEDLQRLIEIIVGE
ncbi:ParB/RepB/Spo0J family partition protein [Neofamilia massiliensis]|uniref:ParB/RepB/Spo0J family partition protein n=1 Tax=Neofamilia massiliensis TaxID=1673724 RepID=UPI0006BB5BE9|nr:ParB/RepB/Spo0J family partition protein [Neofamilia massiliensis]